MHVFKKKGISMDTICIIKIFVKVCEEIKKYKKEKLKELLNYKRYRIGKLSIEELLTLGLYYHYSGTKNKKVFYNYINKEFFPHLPSYDKFNYHINKISDLTNDILNNNLHKLNQELGYIDSTKLETTNSYYYGKIYNKSSKYLPKKTTGYSTTGKFVGFKLHVLINSKQHKICNFQITSAKTHDLEPIKKRFFRWFFW